MTRIPEPDLRVKFCGMDLRNPVIAASGTFGYGVEFEDIVSLKKIGGFVTKGLSREPMAGNSPPRLLETPSGMLNAIGLQNLGVTAFVEEKLEAVRALPCIAIANIFGYTVSDYCAVIRALNETDGIDAYEINASCPNTHTGGMIFGTNTGLLYELVANTKSVSRRPLIVKLSPNVTSIAEMARAAVEAGADAISLINTFVSLSIDAQSRRPRLANVTGGLSGPAIKPIALRMVWEVARAVSVPVIGMGGITTPEDVVEFLLAGATAVQVGTASYADPRAVERIARGLREWCIQHHVEKLSKLTGALKTQPDAE
ncbi:MAG TPA: dihydroorotate dehydrogenase [Acidobacteriaceae bacterium]|jgi:dihydroorotate dehydrogenase (NAD+) catalytic subunit|nr:dihydroorotate dehydrogenase [Acidobacteriaceae bacterium]